MHPDQILAAIKTDLDVWAATRKGKVVVARDPLEVIEILAAGPGGLLAILNDEGDDEVDAAGENQIAGQLIGVTVGMPLGLNAEKGRLLYKSVGERRNLARLRSECRARVLSLTLPADGEDVDLHFRYRGCQPVTMPDGYPLAAHKFRVQLDALVETEEPREAEIEE